MSRVSFGSKPYIFPMPVLIIGTYDENGIPDAMNAAWGMISDFNEITISLSNHKTTNNLLKTGVFTVSLATEKYMTVCDYVGIESANNNPDKFNKSGFHAKKSELINAPIIDELPVVLECKVKSYNDEILIGEIINVSADESVITDGKIDIKKVNPISYDPMSSSYVSVGEIIGKAFSVGLKLK